MANISGASNLDRFRLETTFHGDHVIHTTYNSNLAAVDTKWTKKRRIGSGAYGIVTLEENERGQLRAVKRITLGVGEIDYYRELKALSSLTDVRTH